jgi:hypothetical protein
MQLTIHELVRRIRHPSERAHRQCRGFECEATKQVPRQMNSSGEWLTGR